MLISNSMAVPSIEGSFRRYLREIGTFSILDETEERQLAERVQRDHDSGAAAKLINGHLRFVVYIARQYTGYGLPLEDLVQEGNIGLIKAVRHYDPSRCCRLTTYSSYWIRTHILEYILNNWRIVKVATTKSKRKLFYKLRSIKNQLNWLDQREVKNIAKSLDVKSTDVIEMESNLYLEDLRMETQVDASSEDTWSATPAFQGSDPSPDELVSDFEFLNIASEELKKAVSTLDARSRDIIEKRWLVDNEKRFTLKKLGKRHRISVERVRQLELIALLKLREILIERVGVNQFDVNLPGASLSIAA